MGLDMYLYKRRYVKNWEHSKEKWSITVKRNGEEVKDTMPVSYVVYDAGYWRKANAVHQWFIDNCAGGDGDRTTIYVARQDLEKLREVCQQVVDVAKTEKGKVANGYGYKKNEVTGEMEKEYHWEDGITITNPEEVAKILPTQEGFFFGSTDYDQWYLEDIKDTIKICDEALADDGHCEFEYHASW